MKLKNSLSLFSKAELKELGKLLDAAIFGNQPSIAACYHACLQLTKQNPGWTEQDLSSAIFPDKSPIVNIKYLRTRTSALMRHIEQYLAWKTFQQDPILQSYCLVTALNQRGWENEYRHAYARAIQEGERAPFRGFEHYATELEIFEDNIARESPILAPASVPQFDQALIALDKAFVLKKFSLAAKAYSQDHIRQTRHNIALLPELETWLESQPTTVEPIIRLYALLLKLTRNPTRDFDQYYWEAKELFFRQAATHTKMKLAEAQDILKHLINYCTVRYNQKHEAFRTELADLYKGAIRSGILLTAGQIEPFDFINAFRVFLFVADVAAMNWLLEGYGNAIRGATALATRHYCEGSKLLLEMKAESAADCFMKALYAPPKTKAPHFEASIRAQLARAYYDSSNYWDAEAQARGLIFITKTKSIIDKEKRAAFHDFAIMLSHLCRAQKATARRRQVLINELLPKYTAETKPFFASRWIEAKIHALTK